MRTIPAAQTYEERAWFTVLINVINFTLQQCTTYLIQTRKS